MDWARVEKLGRKFAFGNVGALLARRKDVTMESDGMEQGPAVVAVLLCGFCVCLRVCASVFFRARGYGVGACEQG